MTNSTPICYLCGEVIVNNGSDDHIPPKQFFPSTYRKANLLRLIKIPAHTDCNKSYQKDEDYFFPSLAPLAKNSKIGEGLWHDLSIRSKREGGRKLAFMVLKEFKSSLTSGILLPHGKIVKYFDCIRIYRVIWEITRGLYFIHENKCLAENKPHIQWLFDPELNQPESWELIRKGVINTKSLGTYCGIFDYKYFSIPVPTGIGTRQVWGMLFWDKLLFMTIFHDALCNCEKCKCV